MIQADLATSIERTWCHGSDSAENAAREIAYFFAETALCAVPYLTSTRISSGMTRENSEVFVGQHA